MFFLKFFLFSGIVGFAQLVWAGDALAWGPGVHTLIALNLFNEVHLILPSIAGIISAHPFEYLYGCLAADFFVGKSKMKKMGHAHNWRGGFKFLCEATDDEQMAYAYGLLSHLATDVVAHNFFIPNMINSHYAGRKKSHLYWELRADYLVGPEYTKVARDLLSMDHHKCDERLKTITGKRKRGLKAKKMLFTQSVKFSDRAYTTRHIFFPSKTARPRAFSKYSASMVDLSSRVLKDFLRNPEASPCLQHDPIGIHNLGVAKRNRSINNLFRSRQKVSSFAVAPELLGL